MEANVKKLKKLEIKKVTLRDLDETTLKQLAGGYSQIQPTCPINCGNTVETGKPVCCS
jgi:natural product precursor